MFAVNPFFPAAKNEYFRLCQLYLFGEVPKKFNGYKEGKFLKIENIEPEELFGECLGSF